MEGGRWCGLCSHPGKSHPSPLLHRGTVEWAPRHPTHHQSLAPFHPSRQLHATLLGAPQEPRCLGELSAWHPHALLQSCPGRCQASVAENQSDAEEVALSSWGVALGQVQFGPGLARLPASPMLDQIRVQVAPESPAPPKALSPVPLAGQEREEYTTSRR